MPLKRDEKGGGTNADGTVSTMYCSHCYQDGQFVLPDISMVQMQARVREKIIEFGMPGFLAGIFTRKIPKLVLAEIIPARLTHRPPIIWFYYQLSAHRARRRIAIDCCVRPRCQ